MLTILPGDWLVSAVGNSWSGDLQSLTRAHTLGTAGHRRRIRNGRHPMEFQRSHRFELLQITRGPMLLSVVLNVWSRLARPVQHAVDSGVLIVRPAHCLIRQALRIVMSMPRCMMWICRLPVDICQVEDRLRIGDRVDCRSHRELSALASDSVRAGEGSAAVNASRPSTSISLTDAFSKGTRARAQ